MRNRFCMHLSLSNARRFTSAAALALGLLCTAAAASPQATTPSALLLARARITPSALAIAGVSEAGLQALLSAAASQPASLQTLAAADDAVLAAQTALRAAEEAVWRGGPGDGRDEAVAAARAALAEQQAAQASAAAAARSDLYGAAQVSGETGALLDRLAVNAGRSVPDEYKVLTLGPETWAVLESACAKRRQNQPLSAQESGVWASAEADAQVSDARARLSAGLAALLAGYAISLRQGQ